jgi:hypothetical protein
LIGLHIFIWHKTMKSPAVALSRVGRGLKGWDYGGDITNVLDKFNLCILKLKPLLNMWFTNTVSWYVACLFKFLQCLLIQKNFFLIFIVYLFFLSFQSLVCYLGIHWKSKIVDFTHILSSKNIKFFLFTFSFFPSFEWNFV